MGSWGHLNIIPDVYQFANHWKAATCGVELHSCHTAAQRQLRAGSENEFCFQHWPHWDERQRSRDEHLSLTLEPVPLAQRTWNNYTIRTWVHHCSQIIRLKIQLAASLTPFDALGPSCDSPEFSFSVSSVWSVFPHLTWHLFPFPPTLTDSLAKLNLFLLSFSCNCL